MTQDRKHDIEGVVEKAAAAIALAKKRQLAFRRASDLPLGSVLSRKLGGEAVLNVGGWYYCQCYPCPRLTKWSSIRWNSSVCPACLVRKARAAIAKAEGQK